MAPGTGDFSRAHPQVWVGKQLRKTLLSGQPDTAESKWVVQTNRAWPCHLVAVCVYMSYFISTHLGVCSVVCRVIAQKG